MGVKIKDNDREYKKFLKDMKSLSGSFTKVGVLQGSKAKERGEDGNIHPTNKPLAEVAIKNEFGTENVPARPFMRNAFREAREDLIELKKQNFNMIAAGRRDEKTALARIGAFFVGVIQDQIGSPQLEENAPSTIARKGSSKPLIDTGTLRQSIAHTEFVK